MTNEENPYLPPPENQCEQEHETHSSRKKQIAILLAALLLTVPAIVCLRAWWLYGAFIYELLVCVAIEFWAAIIVAPILRFFKTVTSVGCLLIIAVPVVMVMMVWLWWCSGTAESLYVFGSCEDHCAGSYVIDPISGRFCSKDPIGYRESKSLVEFETGTPLSLMDPLGLCGVAPTRFSSCSFSHWTREIVRKRRPSGKKPRRYLRCKFRCVCLPASEPGAIEVASDRIWGSMTPSRADKWCRNQLNNVSIDCSGGEPEPESQPETVPETDPSRYFLLDPNDFSLNPNLGEAPGNPQPLPPVPGNPQPLPPGPPAPWWWQLQYPIIIIN